MTSLKNALFATCVALAFAGPALAQEQKVLEERNVYLFTMDGRMVQMKVTDPARHATIMKNFKAMAAGTMVYVSGGKIYVGEDKRMDGGKMLHTEIFGKDLSIASQR